jgi:hypothetical protein
MELLRVFVMSCVPDFFMYVCVCIYIFYAFRVLHHGELALECVNAYYLYGRALLYKAQEEADPLAMVPKKDSESKLDDNKDGASRNLVNGEFSSASVSSNAEEGGGSNHPEGAAGGGQYFVAQNVCSLVVIVEHTSK